MKLENAMRAALAAQHIGDDPLLSAQFGVHDAVRRDKRRCAEPVYSAAYDLAEDAKAQGVQNKDIFAAVVDIYNNCIQQENSDANR